MLDTRCRHRADSVSILIRRIKFGGMHWFIKLHQYTYTGERKKRKKSVHLIEGKREDRRTTEVRFVRISEENQRILTKYLFFNIKTREEEEEEKRSSIERMQSTKKWVSFGKRREENFPKIDWAKAQINTTKRIDLHENCIRKRKEKRTKRWSINGENLLIFWIGLKRETRMRGRDRWVSYRFGSCVIRVRW